MLIKVVCIKRAFLTSLTALLLMSFAQLDPLDSVANAEQHDFLELDVPTACVSESDPQISMLLQDEDAIQYYAYLDISTAESSLQPVILEARKIIAFRYSWVADGLHGFVHDNNGNIVEEVPQFSDLFPADWEEPIVPTEVDLSYYGVE